MHNGLEIFYQKYSQNVTVDEKKAKTKPKLKKKENQAKVSPSPI